ncbi:MAG TPA: STAS domain-containing protein [Solirubrobacteraceae bacterium]|nr:STAS domain-containing protein [Solirubrobacteraceae bacterium]
MDSFSVKTQRCDGRVVLRLEGELDIATGGALEQEADRTLGSDHEPIKSVIVDLDRLAFVDLAGLRAICRCAELARDRGAGFEIARAPAQARRVFELCGLDELLAGASSRRSA